MHYCQLQPWVFLRIDSSANRDRSRSKCFHVADTFFVRARIVQHRSCWIECLRFRFVVDAIIILLLLTFQSLYLFHSLILPSCLFTLHRDSTIFFQYRIAGPQSSLDVYLHLSLLSLARCQTEKPRPLSRVPIMWKSSRARVHVSFTLFNTNEIGNVLFAGYIRSTCSDRTDRDSLRSRIDARKHEVPGEYLIISAALFFSHYESIAIFCWRYCDRFISGKSLSLKLLKPVRILIITIKNMNIYYII